MDEKWIEPEPEPEPESDKLPMSSPEPEPKPANDPCVAELPVFFSHPGSRPHPLFPALLWAAVKPAGHAHASMPLSIPSPAELFDM